MTMFDEAERTLLRSLRENEVWQSILETLAETKAIPGYSPADGDEEAKKNRWVYESGVVRGRKDVVKLLSDG